MNLRYPIYDLRAHGASDGLRISRTVLVRATFLQGTCGRGLCSRPSAYVGLRRDRPSRTGRRVHLCSSAVKNQVSAPQKKLAKTSISPYYSLINATPNDIRKTAMADARRALESSADFTRGGTPPVPDHDATERQRAERIEAEQRRLIVWAKAHGKLGGRLPKDDVGGGEHTVRLDEKADRVIKATRLEKQKGYGIALGSYTHGATPSEYLDRLNLQNTIFNDDIRLERVVLKNGNPVVVTSQPAIKGTVPTQAAIDETMVGKGFEKLTPGAYYDEKHGLLLYDLFPKNAMQAADGVIYPFDPVIQRIQQDFAEFLRANPDRIHNR